MLLLLPVAQAAEPQHWAVAGVATGDTLAVRATPDAKAKAVGRLAPGTRGLVELATDESGWLRVRAGKVEGWVNGRYLVPELPENGALPPSLTCTGTEPFWGVQLQNAVATYASPDAPKGTPVATTTVRATMDAAFLVTPAADGGWSWMTVELDAQTCSDGMSSRRYPYRALALTGEQGFVAGCCRIPTAADNR